MDFAAELESVLPADLPHREEVVKKTARHLELIEETNREFNLTRILGAREAAIKHVLDSIVPWRQFAECGRVLDAGTGAGFPGIPLAVVLPDVHFVLTDSTGKKARFVARAVEALELGNVTVEVVRAEEWLRKGAVDAITGRALAPLDKTCGLFGPAVRRGVRALWYKGPDASTEILDAAAEARKYRLKLRIVEKFELPDGAGGRTLVEMMGGVGGRSSQV